MKLAEKVAPAHTAVVVIDVQQEFFAAGGVIDLMGDDPIPLRAMIPRLADFLERARGRVRLVVFTKQTYAPELRSPVVEEHQVRSGMKRAPTPEAEEFYGLEPAAGDVVLPKNRYSAFVGTPLDTMLRANSIATLILTGVATNVCVESTARQGFVDVTCDGLEPGSAVSPDACELDLTGVLDGRERIPELGQLE